MIQGSSQSKRHQPPESAHLPAGRCARMHSRNSFGLRRRFLLVNLSPEVERVRSEWNSMQELVEEFDLPCDASDLDCIKRVLRTRLREIHPDRTPGAKFRDDEERALYDRLSEARAFVEMESKKSTAIVKSSELTGIIRDLRRELARMQKANAAVEPVQTTEEVSNRSRLHYRRLRIGSGTFAAVVVATLAFTSRAKDYPLLGSLFQHPVTKILALVCIACAGGLFLWTWLWEANEKAWVEHLVSEEGTVATLSDVCRSAQYTHERTLIKRDEEGVRFTKRYYARQIRDRSRYDFDSSFWRFELSTRMAERVADFQLKQLVSRGAIRVLGRPGIDQWYEVPESLVTTMEDGGFSFGGLDYRTSLLRRIRLFWQRVKKKRWTGKALA